jgi:UDP-N-acetylglucosamine:LPS N-acetylglucosamine transferase
MVRHIYLGLPEAQARLKLGRETQVFDTGNPIIPPDPSRREAAAARLGVVGGKPVLLVTGGSQGSLAINETVAAWIESGAAKDVVVLWATGKGSYQQFASLHQPPAVKVFDFIDPMADAYSVADLVVARAGMMTGAELCAWGLPSILIRSPVRRPTTRPRTRRLSRPPGPRRCCFSGTSPWRPLPNPWVACCTTQPADSRWAEPLSLAGNPRLWSRFCHIF